MPINQNILLRITEAKATKKLDLSGINLSKINIDELILEVSQELKPDSYHELNLSNCQLGKLVTNGPNKSLRKLLYALTTLGTSLKLNLDDNNFDIDGFADVYMFNKFLEIDGDALLFNEISMSDNGVSKLLLVPDINSRGIIAEFIRPIDKQQIENIKRQIKFIAYRQLMANSNFNVFKFKDEDGAEYDDVYQLSTKHKNVLFVLLIKQPKLQSKIFTKQADIMLDVDATNAWAGFQNLLIQSNGKLDKDTVVFNHNEAIKAPTPKVVNDILFNDAISEQRKLNNVFEQLKSTITISPAMEFLELKNQAKIMRLFLIIKEVLIKEQKMESDESDGAISRKIIKSLVNLNLLTKDTFNSIQLLDLLNFKDKSLQQILPKQNDNNPATRWQRAFWGKICFNENNDFAGRGVFYYGLWLIEMNISMNLNLAEDALVTKNIMIAQHELSGFYWLRISANVLGCENAKNFGSFQFCVGN